MKRLFILMALTLVVTAGFAQSAAPAEVAVATFEGQTFDFGKVKQGVPVTHEFKFTNTGKVPLIITNVQASCGCTTPDWSRDPIGPGAQGFIKATYNAANMGAFNKSVTMTANVENGMVQLLIKGEVLESKPLN